MIKKNENQIAIVKEIKQNYPFVSISITESNYSIEINNINVPEEHRRKGIGRDILSLIKDYAYNVQKPIVLSPKANRGFKNKLEKFYKSLGFIHNKGKKIDWKLFQSFAHTMYWKPNSLSD